MRMFELLAQQGDGGDAAAAAVGGLAVAAIFVVEILLVALIIAGLWKVFTKAGKPGWAAIVPIYHFIVLLEIVGRPIWWLLLLIIPCVNIIVAIVVMLDLAKSFGKSAGFGIGLALLGFIFIPILGFGDAKYIGPAAQ